MTDRSQRIDPLRRTFAAMRQDLDGLIDDEIGRLAGRTGAPVLSGAGPEEARPVNLDSEGERGASPTPPRLAAPRLDSPSARDHLDGTGRADSTDDAGLRLDALARHLEGRLRRPRGRSVEPATPVQDATPAEGLDANRDRPQAGGA